MIVFATSDIHGRLDIIKKINGFLSRRIDIECIILCGDISADYEVSSFEELEQLQYEDYKKILEMLQSIKRKILFIQGNHDVFIVDTDEESYLKNNKLEIFQNFIPIEYLNFIMYGTKREGDDEEMAYRLSKLKVNTNSIIISHLPPHKCLDKDKNGTNYGSKAINELIKDKKPAYFFCGHVHDGFGYKRLYDTNVFNASCKDNTARGWIVNLENGEFEKVIL
jgi:Icc-related predicted phosphoesterase